MNSVATQVQTTEALRARIPMAPGPSDPSHRGPEVVAHLRGRAGAT